MRRLPADYGMLLVLAANSSSGVKRRLTMPCVKRLIAVSFRTVVHSAHARASARMPVSNA